MTGRNLHSHPYAAPVTTSMQQVTCYGEKGVGDINDEWQILDDTVPVGARLQRITSVFRLIHGLHGLSAPCALYSHGTQLPEWGFEQNEVACNPKLVDSGNLWNIETHINDRLPKTHSEHLAPSFFSSFIELHFGMASVNNNLKPKEDEITSQPWEWPLNIKVRFLI